MITTKNARYLHMPKTGGIWMKTILAPIIISDTGHAIPKTASTTKTFVIVRNPWAWYVSWYNYLLYGSEKWPALENNPAFKSFNKIPDFTEFVTMMCRPTEEFKRLSYNNIILAKLSTPTDNANLKVGEDAAKKWIDSNLSFYQHRVNMFLQFSTHIGKTETLRTDLFNMINEVGDLTNDVKHLLELHSDINVSMKVNYKDFYSTDLSKLVEVTHQPFIDNFQYNF